MKVSSFFLGIVVGVAYEQGVVVFIEVLFDAYGDGGEEVVVDIGQDQPHRMRGRGFQRAGSIVGDITTSFDRCFDFCFCFLGEASGLIDDMGNGRRGYAGESGDVDDRDAFFIVHQLHYIDLDIEIQCFCG